MELQIKKNKFKKINKKYFVFLFLTVLLILSVIGVIYFHTQSKEPEMYSIIREYSIPFEDKNDLVELVIESMSQSDLVLLGESTHGTQEFYEYRSQISKELIENHDFRFIAVEGDWNSLYELNLYVKGLSDYSSAKQILETFDRWPVWMWSNEEIELLIEWLKEHNDKNPSRKVGFYGFDVYGAENSLELFKDTFKEKYPCIFQFEEDFTLYPRYLVEKGISCERNAENFYLEIESLEENYDKKEYFNLKQNALVIKNAEKHYRRTLFQDSSSWNKRILHMNESIYNIMEYKNGKGVLWAHNTHVGDARATEMHAQGVINKGQLLRESGMNTFILGFGTYTGEVVAGDYWGSSMRIFEIPNAREDSIESLFYNSGLEKNLFIFDENVPSEIMQSKGHRAIGVVYNPENEHVTNFVNTILPKRYDAFIFFKETNALKPL